MNRIFSYLLVVDLNHIGVVRVQNQSVQVSQLVVLALDLLLGEKVLALVVEDHVDFLGRVAANVRSEHDVVGRVSVQVLLVEVGRVELDVATAAVDLLLVLHCELNDQRLALVRERLEFGRDAVEARVLRRLDTDVLLFIAVEFAVREFECALFGALERRLDPSLFVRLAVFEALLEVDRLIGHTSDH